MCEFLSSILFLVSGTAAEPAPTAISSEMLAQLIVMLAVLFCAVATGVYILLKLRPKDEDPKLDKNQLLAKFRDLHRRKELTNDEFKSLQAMLSKQIFEEVKNEGKEE